MTPTKPQLNPFLKLALDLGPLVLFFFANSRYGIFAATAHVHGRGAGRAGGLLCDDAAPADHAGRHRDHRRGVRRPDAGPARRAFIKVKPTIIYALFGAVLIGGLLFNKPLLGVVFDSLFHLTDEGWRKLTLRWAIFFFALAVLNEIVWRNASTNVWVDFKVFGVVPLTFLFGALQVPLLKKYAAEPAREQGRIAAMRLRRRQRLVDLRLEHRSKLLGVIGPTSL